MIQKFVITLLSVVALGGGMSHAQKQAIDVQRIEPAFWWIGMKNKELQLLIYGKNIAAASITLQYPGVSINRIEKTENPNYQFVYLTINESAKAGSFPITFQVGKKKKTVTYELRNRTRTPEAVVGFTPADAMYLIMPDRFANGDETNDSAPGMFEQSDRSKDFRRHGGDLKGIEDHIDYIKDLGFTAVWLNPVQENNQPAVFEHGEERGCYHGYAITDFYKIDPRFGTNESYNALVKKFHDNGIKVVMDMVFNHCGCEHWFIKDLPSKDWVHQFPEYTTSNYRLATTIDPYASKADIDKMQQGWFDRHMPDLNQHNPHLATYLIQNSIWWVEYSQLDGIRMDTHPYPYKDFMSTWCKAVMTEYPNFNIVGEVWEEHVLLSAYFQSDSKNPDGYQGNMPSVTDFAVMAALNKAFNEKDGWEEGLTRIYYALIQDFAYTHANNNLIFLDNHDLTRFATSVRGDINKQKMGFAALLTLRGIPQFFYGGEIGMLGDGGNHGKLRTDFPGGWKGDSRNAFTAEGRTAEENDLFNYLRTLLQWRKTKTVLHTGKLMHFIPEHGMYVYFRYNDTETVMVVLNNNGDAKTIDTKRFGERLSGFTSGRNVITSETISNLNSLTLPGKSAMILELK